MKKFYKSSLVALSTLFCTAGFAQTEMVKDFHPADKGFGLAPTSIVSTSEFMVFSGTADAKVHPIFGTNSFPEPFVTNGTAEEFYELDLNPMIDNGTKYGSNPKNFFVFKDEIYFTATSDTATALYKISALSGSAEFVTSKWVPSYQPQIVMSGFPASEHVAFVGKDPNNAEDDNYYILLWDGEAEMPSMKSNQTSMFAGALYSIDGTRGFVGLGGVSDIWVFGAQNLNEDIGTELCVAYYNRARGAQAIFTDLNEGTKTVNEVVYQLDGSPEDFTVIDNVIYFNSAITNEVWKLDIGAGQMNAVKVDTINSSINQNTIVKLLSVYDGKLVFSGVKRTATDSTSTSPVNLFTYDPATEMVEALITSSEYEIRDPRSMVAMGDYLYFGGNYRSIPYDYTQNASPLFRYDGSEIVNLTPGLKSVREMHAFNDKLYFSAKNDTAIDNGDGSYSSSYDELFVYDPSFIPTGLSKEKAYQKVQFWPNPSNGVLNISGAQEGVGTYSLYNLNGQLMDEGKFSSNKIQYDVPKGTYLLRVYTQNQMHVEKIMVE